MFFSYPFGIEFAKCSLGPVQQNPEVLTVYSHLTANIIFIAFLQKNRTQQVSIAPLQLCQDVSHEIA